MNNCKTLTAAVVLLVLLLAAPAIAQIANPQRGGIRMPKAPRQEPCWQEAGISKSAMEQRKQIEQNTRAEIQSVCNDSALTPQQQREKIRQLHQQTRQQIEGVITPQQQEALKACQQQRAAAHPRTLVQRCTAEEAEGRVVKRYLTAVSLMGDSNHGSLRSTLEK